jgi:hypothetical protein
VREAKDFEPEFEEAKAGDPGGWTCRKFCSLSGDLERTCDELSGSVGCDEISRGALRGAGGRGRAQLVLVLYFVNDRKLSKLLSKEANVLGGGA